MHFSMLDIITAILLLISFLETQNAQERKRKPDPDEMDKKVETATKLREILIKDNCWAPEQEAHYQELLDWEAAKMFIFWFGTRSFPVSLCCAFITYVLGLTSLPGIIFGFWISSPRAIGKTIYFFHLLFSRRSNTK